MFLCFAASGSTLLSLSHALTNMTGEYQMAPNENPTNAATATASQFNVLREAIKYSIVIDL